MKCVCSVVLFSSLLSCAVIGLSGCSGFAGASFPDGATAVSSDGTVTAHFDLQGSDYGGHAPLVGAHIYLVQPGTTGYGSVVTGLLSATSTAQSSYPPVLNYNDQYVPATDAAGKAMYFEVTDTNGFFNLTGDYTCSPGKPVYVIGYGGQPQTAGTALPTAPISNESVQDNGSTGGTLYYVIPSSTSVFVGEQVAASGFTGANVVFNQSGTILSITPVGGFNIITIFTPYDTQYTGGTVVSAGLSGTLTLYPSFNPAAVNMAVLGNCPSTAPYNFGSSSTNPIRFVYMNEVSTTAMAYAFAGYVNSSATSQTGNDEFHIGSTNTTQGLQGIANAALMANILYDIQGSTLSTVLVGEGHIARNFTPGTSFTATATNGSATLTAVSSTTGLTVGQGVSGAGIPDLTTISAIGTGTVTLSNTVQNGVTAGFSQTEPITAAGPGTVPQATVDTIANILAACVDSGNTYNTTTGTGTQVAACKTLGQYASDNGVYDTTSTTHPAGNIAQAAFNMARFPQGAGTGTTSGSTQTVTAGNSTTAAAYVSALYNLPQAGVPFTPNLVSSGAGQPNDLSVTINWQTSSVSGTAANTALSAIAIDGSGNVWTAASAVNKVFALSPSGAYTTYTPPTGSTVSTVNPGGIAIDTTGNVWVSAGAGTLKFVPGTTTGTVIGTATSTGASQLEIDSSGYLYIANNNGQGSGNAASTLQQIQKINTAGTVQTGFPLTAIGAGTQNSSQSCVWDTAYLTIDGSSNIWTVNQNNTYAPDAEICRFTSAGVLKFAYNLTPGSSTALPHSVAIDNGGNAWFAEKDTPYVGKIAAGTTTNNTGLTQSATANLSQPRGVAVDGANTIWVSNNGNGSIVHYSNADVALSPTSYTGSGSGATDYAQIAVDITGNVWALESGGQLVEYVGAGTPTALPFSAARAAGTLGAKP